jgi:putative peptidoglycan lipid II flippase
MEEGDHGQLTRWAGLVGLLTLASRVLGLVRDAVVAAFFPKGGTDAFFVAFTVPNVLRRLLAEGALTVAFIPVFTEYREGRGLAQAREMLANMLGTALAVVLGVTALGMVFAPQVVLAFAYGLTADPGRLALAVTLTRTMFAFLVWAGLSALAMGALNSVRHFTAPALAPAVLNVFIIGAVVVGASRMAGWGFPPTMAIAIGVVVGGAAQLVLQLPVLRRHGLVVAPRWGFGHPGVRRVARLMGPSVFALAIYQLYVMLARQFASFLPEGSISTLYYAQRLVEFPIGIFAVALATVTMPALSSQASAGEIQQVKATYGYALRLVFFVLLPATAGLLALSQPLTSVLFQRGQFTSLMAQQTAWTLVGFSLGLWAAGGIRQTVQVFYALQDTRTPVKVSAVSLLVFILVAYLGYRPLGTPGLALATSVASAANFVLLVWLLRRRLGRLGLGAVLTSALRAGLAALPCGAAAHLVARLGQWERGGGVPANYLVLLAAVIAGLAAFIAASRLLRVAELDELRRALRKKP